MARTARILMMALSLVVLAGTALAQRQATPALPDDTRLSVEAVRLARESVPLAPIEVKTSARRRSARQAALRALLASDDLVDGTTPRLRRDLPRRAVATDPALASSRRQAR